MGIVIKLSSKKAEDYFVVVLPSATEEKNTNNRAYY
jgi:hypothetical protein